MARAFDIGVTAWSPLASGVLSGKYSKGAKGGEEKRLDKSQFVQLTERNLAIAGVVEDVAKIIGKTSSQVASTGFSVRESSRFSGPGNCRSSRTTSAACRSHCPRAS